jgi:ubiquinone/menaquinone biosynthesis C-methylase UbiE
MWASLYALVSRNPASNRAVVEAAGVRPDDRILDIGCGPGAALAQAAALATAGTVSGVDPTPRMVTVASRRVPTATVKVGGAENLPFDDDSFTIAWSIAAYHHWPDQEAGIAEAHRVLAAGGRLLIAENTLDQKHGHGLDHAGIDALAETMRAAGFIATSERRVRAGHRSLTIVTGEAA